MTRSPPCMTIDEGVTRRALLQKLALLGASAAGVRLLAACTPAASSTAAGKSTATARVVRIGLLAPPGPVAGGAIADFWGRLGELGYVEALNLAKVER